MLLAALLVLTTLVPRIEGQVHALGAPAAGVAAPHPIAAPFYQHAARAVSNWRMEASSLRPVSLAAVAQLTPTEPAFVARCAKLNNYWCIKSARWPGEIGSDADGHTGFASAADGADAAAHLLRRYYRDYGRRTALAIVRRWAPAACGLPGTGAGGGSASAGPSAPRGLGRTLRARYLARHLPGGAPRRAIARVRAPALRVQPWSALARMGGRPAPRRVGQVPMPKPVPDLAARIAQTSPGPKPAHRGADDPAALLDHRVPSPDQLVVESAALPLIAGLTLGDLRAPAPLCGGDEARIANYAAAIARSVGLGANDDLALFSADGAPAPNLAPVMLAMSAVELGALHAGPGLVQAAIARLGPAAEAPSADAAR
ncbi:hypothetical protein [uncultured Methylobacterium sp.]|uniref:hypothetical protein n=1 Tax=uncultured Methylobacterium sp. TaxID=157278 RepID=UPI0035CA0651